MKPKFRFFCLAPLLLALFVLLPRTARAYTEADSARLKTMLHDQIWEGTESIEFNATDYGGRDAAITRGEIEKICASFSKEADMFVLNPYGGFLINAEVNSYVIVPPYLPAVLANYEQAKQDYTAALEDLISGVEESWTSVEKLLYCHDQICLRYKRNYVTKATGQVAGDNTTAYLMLTAAGTHEKEGTDMAYAMLFKAMVDALDLPGVQCAYVSGTFKDSSEHHWNAVRLDTGFWYHVDVYEDDFNLTSTVGYTDVPGHASHSYFLVSTNYLNIYDRQAHYAENLVFEDEETVCNSTLYETYVWQYALSPFVRLDGIWYFLDDKEQAIRSWKGNTPITETVLSFRDVYAELDDPAGSYIAFTGLFSLGARLYFTTTRYIMRFDPVSLEWEVLMDSMDKTRNSNYQIRGCGLQTDLSGGTYINYLLWYNNDAQFQTEPFDPYRIVEGSTEDNGYAYYAEGGLLYLRLKYGYPVMVASFDASDRMLQVRICGHASRGNSMTDEVQTVQMPGTLFRIFAIDSESKPRCEVREGKWSV